VSCSQPTQLWYNNFAPAYYNTSPVCKSADHA
jgi:hypothetical protein